MKIIPSLLAENFETFTGLVKKSEKFTDYVQVDLMDGVFVDSRSFAAKDINLLDTSLSFEVHLMFEDPVTAFEGLKNEKLRRVIFHIESNAHAQGFVHEIKGKGLKAGIALNPETETEVLRGLKDFDSILLLTVDPGRYGSPFKPEVLKKAAKMHELYPGISVGVDGGVSLDNLELIKTARIDYACVGSRILLQPDPAASYREFAAKAGM